MNVLANNRLPEQMTTKANTGERLKRWIWDWIRVCCHLIPKITKYLYDARYVSYSRWNIYSGTYVENRGKLLYVSIMYDQHMTARGRHTRCFSTGPHTNEPTRPALLKISLNISKCVKIPISYISKTGLRLEKTFTSPSACLLWLDYRRSMCFKDQ